MLSFNQGDLTIIFDKGENATFVLENDSKYQ